MSIIPESALKNKKGAIRYLIIFSFLLLIILIAITILAFLIIPQFAKNLARKSNVHIEYNKGGTYISLGDYQRYYVVNVPAYRAMNNTGILMKKGDELKIIASGLVCTGGFYDIERYFCGHEEQLNRIIEDIMRERKIGIDLTKCQEIDKHILRKIKALNYNRSIALYWRDPNGKLQIGEERKASIGNRAIHEHSKKLKLNPEANWGCLIGWVCPENMSEEQMDKEILSGKILGKEKTFIIGKEATIEYKNDGLHIYTGGVKKSIKSYGKVWLYVGVNDCIVKDIGDIYPSSSEDQKGWLVDIAGKEALLFRKILIENTVDFDKFKKFYNLWYLDNKGSFTLMAIQKIS